MPEITVPLPFVNPKDPHSTVHKDALDVQVKSAAVVVMLIASRAVGVRQLLVVNFIQYLFSESHATCSE
jgi:hypothetical protein